LKRNTFISFGLFYIFATYATYFLIGLGLLQVMHLFGIHNFFGWLAAGLVLYYFYGYQHSRLRTGRALRGAARISMPAGTSCPGSS